MKQIEQLQEILCTAPSVEKDVKELRFGCKLLNPHTKQVFQFTQRSFSLPKSSIKAITGNSFLIAKEDFFENKGNPLSLKHLMMYCNEKGIDIDYNPSGALGKDNGTNKPITKLDITKELYEQEDKVLLDIINFLKG